VVPCTPPEESDDDVGLPAVALAAWRRRGDRTGQPELLLCNFLTRSGPGEPVADLGLGV